MASNNIYFDMLNDENFIDMIVRRPQMDNSTIANKETQIGGKIKKIKKEKRNNRNNRNNRKGYDSHSHEPSLSDGTYELDIDTTHAIPHAGFPPIFVCDKTINKEQSEIVRSYAKVLSSVSIRDIMEKRRNVTPLISF